jgi:hypothetical protein
LRSIGTECQPQRSLDHDDPDQDEPDQDDPDHDDPDQLEPDHDDPDQLEPDHVEPDHVDPDQLDPDQLDPDQLKPFHRPPDQLLPAVPGAKGCPKMSISPCRTTPSLVRWSRPRDSSTEPVPVEGANAWVEYEPGVEYESLRRSSAPSPCELERAKYRSEAFAFRKPLT